MDSWFKHRPIKLFSRSYSVVSLSNRSKRHPSDYRHPTGFVVDRKLQVVRVWWGGYGYEVDLDRIDSPSELLQWVRHLSGKTWENTTPQRIHGFINAAIELKKFKHLNVED